VVSRSIGRSVGIGSSVGIRPDGIELAMLSPLSTAAEIPPEQPPTCPCFAQYPDPRRPQHVRIQSPYCPLLPWPEFREDPCICFATALRPSEIIAHSHVTSLHCPLFSGVFSGSSNAEVPPCTSCGFVGHRTNESSLCPHRISGRVFQPFVHGSPGRKYHDEEAPTLSVRCRYCKCEIVFFFFAPPML
jgi:hypothetical protein